MSHWHLASVNWLDGLPANAERSLRSAAQRKVYKDKGTIFAPTADPDAVYLLESGLARIYRLAGPGEEFTLCIVEPGEVFGELAVLNEDTRESFAVALDTCTALRFSKDLFLDLMRSIPSFSLTVTKQVGRRLERLETRAEDLVFRSVASRLAKTLLWLADDFGRVDGRGMIIDLRLTQSEIATLIGSSRPTVNLTMGAFKEKGLISSSGGHIVVVDREALKKIADDAGYR